MNEACGLHSGLIYRLFSVHAVTGARANFVKEQFHMYVLNDREGVLRHTLRLREAMQYASFAVLAM